jgi:hypothetical protein
MSNMLYDEIEISLKRFSASSDQILNIFKKFSELWNFDGLPLTTQHTKEDNKNILLGEISTTDPRHPIESYCLGYLELNRVNRKGNSLVDIRLVCSWPPVMSFWQELDRILAEQFPNPLTLKKRQERRREGPTLTTQLRANAFKEIKTDHPEWSKPKVAEEYFKVHHEYVSSDDVGNTYRAMGWPWERSDRIR